MGRMQSKLVALALLCLALPASGDAPTRAAEDTHDFVSDVLPYPIDLVHERIMTLFDSDARDYYDDYNPKIYDLPEEVPDFRMLSPQAVHKFRALPLVRANKFYVFFGAYATMQGIIQTITPFSAMGHNNAALEHYATLSPEARSEDIYLWSPDVPYWHSEYVLGEKPLPFKSFFIIHLAVVDATHTQVEIIENEPVVRLSSKQSVDIHGTLHHSELQEVAPTTSDREFLLSCIGQFIERNVPGRHWFTCHQKGEVIEVPVPFTVP